MRRLRVLCVGTAIAGGAVAWVVPGASGDQRQIVVTLLGGKQVTVTVDVPPGTPLDEIALPGITTPVVSVAPVGAVAPKPEEPAPAAEIEAPQVKTGKKSRKPEHQDEAVVEKVAKKLAEHRKPALRLPNAAPTPANPTFSLALPGPVDPAHPPVPNFFIEKFRIPPFLLPIYQAAGIQYGVRWEVLAAINEIETDYGRNLNVSSAGAVGWMQFLPSSWRRYGLDANGDGRKDPYNPVDAIFSAARYLRAANAEKDLRGALFAYNHADWYVDSVVLRAQIIGGLPSDLVGSLTGLTQGHFPVHARATYADEVAQGRARRAINIFAKPGSPVIAVQDGKITRIGYSSRLGRFVQLQDAYGNTYTYGHLKKLAKAYPAPTKQTVSARQIARELQLPKPDPAPTQAASGGVQRLAKTAPVARVKERLFANPTRPRSYRSGGQQQLLDGDSNLSRYAVMGSVYGVKRSDVQLRPLRKGSRVSAGTILGRIGVLRKNVASHVLFEIRPAGRGAPRIDPKPILDGWKLLESTAIYRAKGRNPFVGDAPSIGQILLMSKETLAQRVLADPRVEMYDCGRQDIRAGIVDRRILATLEFLSASGLKPTVTSLRCGHGYYTKSGNVSEHSFGAAVDIAKINGIPILGHQGPGSVADMTVRRLLTLQGTMAPHQIITLMTYQGADNTFAMADHADHIHVGFRGGRAYSSNSKLGRKLAAVLKPTQWIKLIDRISQIDNPTVLTARASSAHKGV